MTGDLATTAPADAFIQRIKDLVAKLDLPAFQSLGVDAREVEEIAAAARANGSNASNPRPMTESDYVAILESVLA